MTPTAHASLLAALVALASAAPAAELPRARNAVLITLDGVRVEELFGGVDAVVLEGGEEASGVDDPARTRARYWRPSPEERRQALMPFFWGTLAPRGVVYGNRQRGGRVDVTNPLRFSAPGYAEILTGRPQPDVVSNDSVRYPHESVLQRIQRELGLGYYEVATIGSWDGFGLLSSSEAGAFFTNSGYEDLPAEVATPRASDLAALQWRILPNWDTGRSDVVTFGIALEYLKQRKPRLLYLALDESDDWSHARRYDRLLDYLHVVDGMLEELWTALQSIEEYRARTTLILTTDHGRGRTAEDWVEHGEDVPGSEAIWVAVIGPDTPARGDAAPHPPARQTDVAPTLLQLSGLDPGALGGPGSPLPGAFVGDTPGR